MYDPTVKSWKFESNDFATSQAINGTCSAGQTAVYRAYNNGFTRGFDSNHRISTNLADIQTVVGRGWSNEGIVMCAAGNATGWQSGAIVRLPHPQGGSVSTRTMLHISAVDVDGDGRKDLVLGYTFYYETRGIQDLKNNGDRTFTDISAAMLGDQVYIPGAPSGHIYAVDVNGDGCVDLLEAEATVVSGKAEVGRILLNDCHGKFVNANPALASVLNKLPGNQSLLPFTDYTGRTSFYVPIDEQTVSHNHFVARLEKCRARHG